MAEKKTTSSPLPREKNAEWKHGIVVDAHHVAYASVAGVCGAFFFKSPSVRWSLLAFGAGVGIGSGYKKYPSSKFAAAAASPDGEN